MRAGRGGFLLFDCGLPYTQGDIGKFQKTAAVGGAAGTILPGAFAGRALQTISWCDPQVLGKLGFLI